MHAVYLLTCSFYPHRRQKRWWNAYLLFYERVDVLSQPDRDTVTEKLNMPVEIKRSVRKENIQFLHAKTQFSEEFFQFIKKLTLASVSQHAQNNNNNRQVSLFTVISIPSGQNHRKSSL